MSIRYRGSDTEGIFSGVNITPFTDVVLVLLIVFMVSAPGIFRSVLNIELPEAGSAEEMSRATLRIGIDKSGELYVDEQSTTIPQLEALIGERRKQQSRVEVVINADRRTMHGRVIEVMDLLREQGVDRIMVGAARQ